MEDQNKPFPPKTLGGLLGAGYKRRMNLPPYGELAPIPEGGLLGTFVHPEAEPPAVSIEARIDARLAESLAAIGCDDDSDPVLH